MIELINESDYDLAEESDFIKLGEFLLKELNVDKRVELNIVFVDEATSEKMHIDWMELPGPTDVLSFPVDEITPGFVAPANIENEIPVLGDVVICPSVAQKQSLNSGHTAHEEMLLLATHGILHLLGYDHEKEDEKTQMFELQRKLLIQFIALKNSIPVETVEIKGLP